MADPSILEPGPCEPPMLLIGMDQMYRVMKLSHEVKVHHGLGAKNSKLGWLIGGAASSNVITSVGRIRDICCVATQSKIEPDVERIRSLDALGIEEQTDHIEVIHRK